jgi:hypothetical protein
MRVFLNLVLQATTNIYFSFAKIRGRALENLVG